MKAKYTLFTQKKFINNLSVINYKYFTHLQKIS